MKDVATREPGDIEIPPHELRVGDVVISFSYKPGDKPNMCSPRSVTAVEPDRVTTEWIFFELARCRERGVVVLVRGRGGMAAVDRERFPHDCRRCGKPAYYGGGPIGFECSGGCS